MYLCVCIWFAMTGFFSVTQMNVLTLNKHDCVYHRCMYICVCVAMPRFLPI